ncbi:MAG: hypothetical protein LWY06_16725 [Firmicutes bacterium]|nr:hypothetical protein [Bacillota bacterium]
MDPHKKSINILRQKVEQQKKFQPLRKLNEQVRDKLKHVQEKQVNNDSKPLVPVL